MKDKTRRKLVLGSGAVFGSQLLPDVWKKPIVNIVMLPAHAQTSVCGAGVIRDVTLITPSPSEINGTVLISVTVEVDPMLDSDGSSNVSISAKFKLDTGETIFVGFLNKVTSGTANMTLVGNPPFGDEGKILHISYIEITLGLTDAASFTFLCDSGIYDETEVAVNYTWPT